MKNSWYGWFIEIATEAPLSNQCTRIHTIQPVYDPVTDTPANVL